MKGVRKLICAAGPWTGSTSAIVLALLAVAVWLVVGLVGGFSEGLLLAAGTGTTLVTFVMVFVIQHAQNRDSRAIQLKLDELIRGQAEARTHLVRLEHLSDEDLDEIEHEFHRLREEVHEERS